MIKNVLGIIMNVNNTNALGELAGHRTTSAIPFGGRYRVIDFMLSNMINSSITNVGLVMQEKYQSLMDHVGNGKDWDLSRKNGGLILLPPYSYSYNTLPSIRKQYLGSMDAICGVVDFLHKSKCDYVILADGDIIGNIELDEILDFHIDSGVEVTAVCTQDIQKDDGIYFSLNRKKMVSNVCINSKDDNTCSYNCIGIYVMKKEYLISLIKYSLAHNLRSFEYEVLLKIFEDGRLNAYVFDKYAVKIKNIKTYFDANMDLLNKDVRDEIFLKDRPIYTKIHNEEPTHYGKDAEVRESLIADGCMIRGNIDKSIIFRNVSVEKGANIKNCVVMQNATIKSGANISYIISDKSVVIEENRTMLGNDTYPVYISRDSIV